MIPEENVRDLAEVPDNVKEGLEIRAVKTIDDVLPAALVHMPEPLAKAPIVSTPVESDQAARH